MSSENVKSDLNSADASASLRAMQKIKIHRNYLNYHSLNYR